MREQDIFEKTQNNLNKALTRGLVLLLAGLLGLGYYLIGSSRLRSQAQPFTKLEDQVGKLVNLELIWLDTAFAQRSDPDSWYHFAQSKDYSLLVLELNQDEHERMTNYIAADSKQSGLEAHPYALQGLVKPSYTELKPYITDTFNSYQLEDEGRLSPSDPRASYMVSVGALPSGAFWPLLLLIPGLLGLVQLLTALAGKRGLKRGREELQQALPDLYDLSQLESGSQLHIPEQNLLVYEPMLISYGQALQVADLRQAGWIYAQHTRQRYNTVHQLMVHLLNKKVRLMGLKGKTQAVNDSLLPLWAYLSEHHPDIQQGYAKEQRQQFKKRIQ